MRMSFGKYQGKELSEIPVSYLEYCLEKLDYMSPRMRTAIRLELGLEERGSTWRIIRAVDAALEEARQLSPQSAELKALSAKIHSAIWDIIN